MLNAEVTDALDAAWCGPVDLATTLAALREAPSATFLLALDGDEASRPQRQCGDCE